MVIAKALCAMTELEAASAVLDDRVSAQGTSVFAVTSERVNVPGDALLADLRRTGRDDASYCSLLSAVQQGGALPREFEKVRYHLWVQDGLLLHGLLIVPPAASGHKVLQRLHTAHLGAERTLRLARQSVFWPGLPSDVRYLTTSCRQCDPLCPSQVKEALIGDPMPDEAFQEIACDFAEVAGRHHLVVVDRFSGYPLCYPVSGYPTAEKMMAALRELFGQFGALQRLFSDGRTQFTAASFADFLRH